MFWVCFLGGPVFSAWQASGQEVDDLNRVLVKLSVGQGQQIPVDVWRKPPSLQQVIQCLPLTLRPPPPEPDMLPLPALGPQASQLPCFSDLFSPAPKKSTSDLEEWQGIMKDLKVNLCSITTHTLHLQNHISAYI